MFSQNQKSAGQIGNARELTTVEKFAVYKLQNNLCIQQKKKQKLQDAANVIKMLIDKSEKGFSSESWLAMHACAYMDQQLDPAKKEIEASLSARKESCNERESTLADVISTTLAKKQLAFLGNEALNFLVKAMESSIATFNVTNACLQTEIDEKRYDENCANPLEEIFNEKTVIQSWGWMSCRYDRLRNELCVAIPGEQHSRATHVFHFLDKKDFLRIVGKQDHLGNPFMTIYMEACTYDKIMAHMTKPEEDFRIFNKK
jgi:hypothetical protein